MSNSPIFCILWSVRLHLDIEWIRGSTGIPKSVKINGCSWCLRFQSAKQTRLRVGLICAVCRANVRTLCFTTICVNLNHEYVQIACFNHNKTQIRRARNEQGPVPRCELAVVGERSIEEAGLEFRASAILCNGGLEVVVSQDNVYVIEG